MHTKGVWRENYQTHTPQKVGWGLKFLKSAYFYTLTFWKEIIKKSTVHHKLVFHTGRIFHINVGGGPKSAYFPYPNILKGIYKEKLRKAQISNTYPTHTPDTGRENRILCIPKPFKRKL